MNRRTIENADGGIPQQIEGAGGGTLIFGITMKVCGGRNGQNEWNEGIHEIEDEIAEVRADTHGQARQRVEEDSLAERNSCLGRIEMPLTS